MKKLLYLFVAVLLLAPALGLAQLTGTAQLTGATAFTGTVVSPTISNVRETSSASTIAVGFTSSSVATPGFACGTTSGTYDHAAKDSGVDVLSPVNHVQIVVGLTPSTIYYCQGSASNTAGTAMFTFSIATTATPTSTPITGVTYTTPASMASVGGCTSTADTFYNALSDDGKSYFLNNDTQGWQCPSGNPAYAALGADMTVGVFDSLSPLTGHTINFLTGYGVAGQHTTYDSHSAKTSGIFAMARALFIWAGGQINLSAPGNLQTGGNIIWSPDHGKTWNNFQQVDNFTSTGTPVTGPMFTTISPTTMGSCTFGMYGGDDGTLGYFQSVNQHDQADAYVYLYCNDGYWNNGNALYLSRVLRARLRSSNPADYQWYVSGDGNQDSAWSSNLADAQPIISNTGKLGEPAVQFHPALNRLTLDTFYYPEGVQPGVGNLNNTVWLTYEAQHPWGSWTLVNTTSWPTQGYYNQIPIVATAQSGTSHTVVFTGSFCCTPSYVAFTSTRTLQH